MVMHALLQQLKALAQSKHYHRYKLLNTVSLQTVTH